MSAQLPPPAPIASPTLRSILHRLADLESDMAELRSLLIEVEPEAPEPEHHEPIRSLVVDGVTYTGTRSAIARVVPAEALT